MAKITKTAVKAAAAAAAKLIALPDNAGTLDYCEGTDLARTLALAAADGMPTEFNSDASFYELFRAAAEMEIIGRVDAARRKVRQAQEEINKQRAEYREARRNWLTTRRAADKLVEFVKSFHIRGMEDQESGGRSYMHMRIDRGWALGASVTFKFEPAYGRKRINPDNTQQAVIPMEFSVELGWSSTGRSVADSVAAIALYRELTEMAAEAESVFGRERIGEYWGPKVEEEEEKPADLGIEGAL